VKPLALFTVATAATVGVSMAILMLLFPTAADRAALAVTAGLMVAVHVVVFVVVQRLMRWSVWGAWGAGSVLRLATLVIYAVLVSKVLLLPLAPALIGCATFLFLPTVFEPLLLRK